ncbi:hypothetical protein [Frigoriglobus tundricola]|uniref:Uncharacterized protein n=1 Tax=Frigoriglobus tundricola TaxID=2774151 RepID=A0A6M5YPL4_9BACT|nr:hypothetical protein [Frigoriglobus tundricola]QJW94912.1 hypothetical protein FTUN_2438 [Frigoriglobus tundricola]
MSDNPKKGAPEWATNPFSELTEDVGYLTRTLDMCIRGITMFRAMPQMVSAVAKAQGKTDHEDTAKERENAVKHAEFAMKELETGFPILYAQYRAGDLVAP